MAKTPFNIQDQYLNQARKERVKITVVMMSGEQLQGYIKSFDNFCVLIESGGDYLLYKHAISSITSADGQFRLHGGRD
ncbi:RNA chaperone Hfq [Desulfuromonas thiophila]|jgi:host factor-I protein|uniref:RNA-binding protein Hfq n=1 Tax=Desulfuromonas thiophila TaxID=57664 RepID=A0A1G7CY63_9BACT|nr:RNA chaperone Hfq [Desulfuromonas thiophila]MCK9171902.1 RNA chaperone Hfq [Desulfuromonas thiophila]MDD3800729.1 RNA chaperone Hfq [Desulfuromonas thiophila]MDY0398449.1 RNA chaperone Hfq [Desulfuromonas thiophila]SDE44248.1 RNA-binding protein Hfq [Desulfuromonas thiophila]